MPARRRSPDGAPSTDPVDRTHHDAIHQALSQITTNKSICAFGSLFPVGLIDPGLSVEGVGPLEFPIQRQQAEMLLGTNSFSPYRVGDELSTTTWIQRSAEIDISRLSFSDGWDMLLKEAVEKAKLQMGLGPNFCITAELQKLLIHEKGAQVLKPSEQIKSTDRIATLILSLPSAFEGGQLCLSRIDETTTVGLSPLSSTDYQYVSWAGDVQYDLKEVTSGVMLVLVYNLHCADWKATTLPSLGLDSVQIKPLRDALVLWQRASLGPTRPYFLVHFLDHQYSESALRSMALRGHDVLRASVLSSICEQMGFKLFFSLPRRVEKTVLGYRSPDADDEKDPEDIPDFPEATDEYLSLDCWWALGGPNYTTPLEIPADEVLQRHVLENLPSDELCTQSDGNELAQNGDRAFNAALVLVPPRNDLAFEVRRRKDETIDLERGNQAPAEKRLYHMKEVLYTRLQTYRFTNLRFKARHELRQICEVLLGLQHELRGAWHGWPECEVSGAHMRTMDKIAAIGIELDMEDVFHKACQLIESYPECDKCSYGFDSDATFQALVHFACDKDPHQLRVFTSKYLNTFISQKGTLYQRIFACNWFIKQLSTASTLLDIKFWVLARMFDAIAEITKPKPGDAARLVNMSREWGCTSLEDHALPFIAKYLDNPYFLYKALNNWRWIAHRHGADCAKEHCTKILEMATRTEASPYTAGPECDWHCRMLIRICAYYRDTFQAQLIEFFKVAIGSMQSAIMLFNHACMYSTWTTATCLKALCEEILLPRIPKMRYLNTRPLLGQGTHTLSIGPDYSIVVPKDLQEFIRNLSKFDQEEPKRVLEALVQQMAKYSSLKREHFKDVLSPRLYWLLCRTLDDDFPPAAEEQSRRRPSATPRQTSQSNAARQRQNVPDRSKKGSSRGRGRP